MEGVAAVLGLQCRSVVRVEGYGYANTNYSVTATDHNNKEHRLLVKICNEKTREQLTQQVNILKHLQQHNFNTAYPIQDKQGEYVLRGEGDVGILVMPFLPGTPLRPHQVTPSAMAALGASLGDRRS